MKPRVLVVYKKDPYQQYIQELRDVNLTRLLRHRHPDVLDMQRAHVIHEESIHTVVQTLKSLSVTVDLAYRANVKATGSYDLIVTVGGDGTFLQAAHSIQGVPILGVNSDSTRSEAVFCAATPKTFKRMCQKALTRSLPELKLFKLKLKINGKVYPVKAINDVLVTHEDPATMSRYRLKIGKRQEYQKSSGIWISTAAGSSSAVLAAGGVRLPWSSRKYQYRPRELYRGRLTHNKLTGGLLSQQASANITWMMRKGKAYIDGAHVSVSLQFADKLAILQDSQQPVRVLGFSSHNR